SQIKEQLGPYVDGELAPDQKARVDAHLIGCDACTRELRSLEDLATVMSRREPSFVPTNLWTAIENRLDASADTPSHRAIRFRALRIVGIAAAILIAVLGGYALF